MSLLKRTWSRVEASFWFTPAVVVLCSIVAAVLLVELDATDPWKLARWSPRLFGAGADGSRAMLSAIATSMVTVAGVVFSITIVTLSLTSTQYSPSVLRNFMRDRPIQWVLGVFVGVFAYCLVVLRTIRGGDEGGFIPSLAVLGGMVYAMGGIALLIYFIHHVSLAIQSSTIVARIADETTTAIDKLFPDDLGHAPAGDTMPAPRVPARWTEICAADSGYLVSMDGEALVGLARDTGRVLRVGPRVGDFVVQGTAVAAASGEEALSESDAARLQSSLRLGRQRTVQQDPGFGLQQLVDIALRALSPGINDPTTACMCIDRIGALLARLARREMPSSLRMERDDLRLIVATPDFPDWLGLALAPVVLHSRGDVQVLQRVLDVLERVAAMLDDAPARRSALLPVARQVRRTLPEAPSRAAIRPLQDRLRALEQRLRGH